MEVIGKLIEHVFILKKINLYFAYEIKLRLYYFENSFTLRHFLFGGVEMTKMLILINIFILDLVFSLMFVELFNYQMEVLVRTY